MILTWIIYFHNIFFYTFDSYMIHLKHFHFCWMSEFFLQNYFGGWHPRNLLSFFFFFLTCFTHALDANHPQNWFTSFLFYFISSFPLMPLVPFTFVSSLMNHVTVTQFHITEVTNKLKLNCKRFIYFHMWFLQTIHLFPHVILTQCFVICTWFLFDYIG